MPPRVWVVVKVTFVDDPLQIAVWLGVTVTAGVMLAAAVIVTGALVAVGVLAHAELLVITTVTTSPLFKVVLAKLSAVAPATAVPLMNHW